MPDLVTVPGVELIRTGKWSISTGEWEVTADTIRAAIDAHVAGVLRKPVIRLGHNDPRFTGDPAVGYVDNLRASADGNTLIGDLVGVPAWLGKILGSAYPDRSVEGLYDYTAPDGSQHPFVLTGLALLGATRPGVESLKSLQDVARLYDIAAAGQIGGTAVEIPMHTGPAGATAYDMLGVRSNEPLISSLNVYTPGRGDAAQQVLELSRRTLDEFYAAARDTKKPYGDVTYADPGYQADNKKRYPLDTADHVRAAWSYINMPKNAAKYTSDQLARVKSKIKAAAKRLGIEIEAAAAAQPEERAVMASFMERIAQRLGIEPDADEQTVEAALEEALAEQAAPPEPAPVAEPTSEQIAAAAQKQGLVVVDAAQYAATVTAVQELQTVEAARKAEHREQILKAAIAVGKIAPASKEAHLKLLELDPGHEQVLASIPDGLLPVSEMGHAAGKETVIDDDEAFYASLYGSEA